MRSLFSLVHWYPLQNQLVSDDFRRVSPFNWSVLVRKKMFEDCKWNLNFFLVSKQIWPTRNSSFEFFLAVKEWRRTRKLSWCRGFLCCVRKILIISRFCWLKFSSKSRWIFLALPRHQRLELLRSVFFLSVPNLLPLQENISYRSGHTKI